MSILLPTMYQTQILPWSDGEIYGPDMIGGTVKAYSELVSCADAQSFFDGRNAFLSSEAALNKGHAFAPGAVIPSSAFTLQAFSFLADGSYDVGLEVSSGYGEPFTPVTGGKFTLTKAGTIFTTVDQYLTSWTVGDEVNPASLAPPRGTMRLVSLSATPSFYFSFLLSGTYPCIKLFEQSAFDLFAPTCGAPPSPPPPATLTRLPKFANFSQFVNPFGFQKGN